MLQNLIDSLEYTIKSSQNLLNKEEIIRENNKNLQEQIKEQKEYLTFIKGAKEKYQIAVNELYEESVVALQDTLNAALCSVCLRDLRFWSHLLIFIAFPHRCPLLLQHFARLLAVLSP